MRLFHALLFDRYMEGTDLVSISDSWSVLLPRAERLKFTFVVDTVSGGGTPSLSVAMDDGSMVYTAVTKLLLISQPLTSGTNTYTAAYSPTDAYPASGYVSLSAQLGGGAPPPKAHVRIWVCGRGERLITRPAIPASFAAQYQAARMLDEEDKLPGKKRLTKPGSSVIVPPELFVPSAKWEQ